MRLDDHLHHAVGRDERRHFQDDADFGVGDGVDLVSERGEVNTGDQRDRLADDNLGRLSIALVNDDPRQAAWMKARALELLPADPAVCIRAAELFMLRKDWAGAKEAMDRALKAAPDHVDVIKMRRLLEAFADKELDPIRKGSQ